MAGILKEVVPRAGANLNRKDQGTVPSPRGPSDFARSVSGILFSPTSWAVLVLVAHSML
jgi:hypothetical protein